ncbi:unnamed protein product [Adineta ricciae]|uniref:Uncharacterized protein n=1 Tax=Adineta ricciae TaxID=249248 RepID=A0A814MR69_ADIRI|nr:unnamed protein product [Adineta ricciae]
MALTFSAISDCTHGLRCYKCTNCNNPFKSNASMEVETNDTRASCTKTTTRNFGTARDISLTCVETNVKGIGTWCCKNDLCNEATSTLSSFHFGIVLFVLAISMLF